MLSTKSPLTNLGPLIIDRRTIITISQADISCQLSWHTGTITIEVSFVNSMNT